ncbi:hypothetical protein MsedC_1853 [Metallosphaera sedula]|uniref:Uncharacterized protein n=2 Tax=Metallosphaera TaxID=41980 RepID=A0A0K1SQC4_9CREN|nr:hypothetical protein MsedA_1853 [Metallosphaera sedula]AKV77017.1 hypothetical protein MsedB_1855 [Metallosphaera sedula]AKV79269.1 hypothetical protein MsedC_1853 [Metallosphaera sedula]AKV81514.1 hypothetical protein MsedD_1854 [Metallosphaera sedula]QCO30630.1 hypothetical protein DFR88_09145 [Metallosphaera prunae]
MQAVKEGLKACGSRVQGGTLVHPHGNFKYLRPFVEHFGIFLTLEALCRDEGEDRDLLVHDHV